MSRRLSTGSAPSGLPENWKTPWGWPRRGNKGAIWVGPFPVTNEDMKAVESRGWTMDEASLVGIYSRDWSAFQYRNFDVPVPAQPWDTVRKPGGLGSWAYRSQHLPDGIDGIAKPGWWLVDEDGNGYRAKGGEPFHRVALGTGYYESHRGGAPGSPAEGVKVQWDEIDQLFRVEGSEASVTQGDAMQWMIEFASEVAAPGWPKRTAEETINYYKRRAQMLLESL